VATPPTAARFRVPRKVVPTRKSTEPEGSPPPWAPEGWTVAVKVTGVPRAADAASGVTWVVTGRGMTTKGTTWTLLMRGVKADPA